MKFTSWIFFNIGVPFFFFFFFLLQCFGTVLLGLVVQSIVSLTSSLMTNSLTVVAKVFSNALVLLLQKNVSSFCSSYSHFSAKIAMYLEILTSR